MLIFSEDLSRSSTTDGLGDMSPSFLRERPIQIRRVNLACWIEDFQQNLAVCYFISLLITMFLSCLLLPAVVPKGLVPKGCVPNKISYTESKKM